MARAQTRDVDAAAERGVESEPLQHSRSTASVQLPSPLVDATPSLANQLGAAPGIYIQDAENSAQDLRIQVRGFGTRAAFGIRGLRVFVDGLPETLPDGQTQLDALDTANLHHFEIWRGPAASVYGNGSGGVLQLYTTPIPTRPETTVGFAGTSYGNLRTDVSTGATWGSTGATVRGTFTEDNGYRAHSAARHIRVAARVRHRLTGHTHLQLHLDGVHSPFAQDPGGLTRAQMDADRRAARDRNVELNAGEAVNQGRVGLTFSHTPDAHRLTGYAYGLARSFSNRLPVPAQFGDGAIAFTRFSPGAGVRYGYDTDTDWGAQGIFVGADLQHMQDARQRFANVMGRRGELRSEQDETVTNLAPYVHGRFSLGTVQLSGGVRHDTLIYDVDVARPDPLASGRRVFSALSPGLGVSAQPWPWLSTWVSVRSALQAPTTTELGTPDGVGFNRDIAPQLSRQYEVGARSHVGSWLSTSVAVFRINLDGLLVPFESMSGRTFYRNAGRAQRDGVEATANVALHADWHWINSVSYLDARFVDDVADTDQAAGNLEPGVPTWRSFHAVDYSPKQWRVRLALHAVGRIPVNDANSEFAPAYHTVNVRVARPFAMGDYRLTPFIALRNLTNQRYSATLRLNALGGRYYEPAVGINAFAGVRLNALH